MTAEWEMALNHIAQNTETADEFLKWDYRADAGDWLPDIRGFQKKRKSSFREKQKEKSYLANVPAVELMSGKEK